MILFVGDKLFKLMKPGARPFEGAKCEKRLKEWIERLAPNNPSIRIVNRVDFNFMNEAIAAYRNGYPIIALGKNASKALLDIPHFSLPHPSGLNRKINDKALVQSELDRCKRWLDGGKYGHV